jgi:hypothetical protein
MFTFFKKIFIVFSIILYSSFLFPEEIKIEDCAMKKNEVSKFDYSICEDDISFRVFYEMFPTIWESSFFKFIELDHAGKFKDDPTFYQNTQSLKFSILFENIFSYFINISLMVIFSIIVYYSFIGLIKSLEDGEFLGRDWDIKDIIKSSLIVSLLLIPVGDIFFIHFLILLIVVCAISLANYMYGFYLSELASFGFDDIKSDVSKIDESSMTGHNKFYAYSYINNLSKIETCKNQSTQFQIDKNSARFDTNLFNNTFQCLSPDDGVLTVDNSYNFEKNEFKKDTPSFFNYGFVDYLNEKGQVKTKTANSITFGSKYTENCIIGEPYTCGSLNVVVPNFNNNELIKYFLYDEFDSIVFDVIKGIDINNSSNEKIINSGWESLYAKTIDLTKSYLDDNKNDIDTKVDKKYIIAYRMIYEDSHKLLRELSYSYHQMIRNYFFIGNVELESKEKFTNDFVYTRGGTVIPISKTELSSRIDTKSFISYYDQIKVLSYLAQEYTCLHNYNSKQDSYRFTQKIKNNMWNSSSSNQCIDYRDMSVFGLNDDGSIYNDKKTKKRRHEIREEFKKIHNVISLSIYKNLTSVENSFLDSMRILRDESIYKELRQKGWLSFATNLMKINESENIVNKLRTKLVNSSNFNKINYDEKMISNDVQELDDNLSEDYPNFINENNIWSKYYLEKDEIGNYLDISEWSNDLLTSNNTSFIDGTIGISDYLSIIVNPLKPLKEAIGLQDGKYFLNLDENLKKDCIEDISKCPIPKNNPFIQLNKVGHYFIQTATSYYSMVISMYFITMPIKAFKKREYLQNAQTGKKSDANSITNEAKKSIGNGSSKSSSILGFLFDSLSSIVERLSSIMAIVLLLGLVLAYLIPVIPLIYYIVAFLSWFLLVIQILFISPIWVAYLLKSSDNKREINMFAVNYGLQILLKPLFMVISLVFIWSFYTVIVFFINITIFPLLMDLQMDGVILSIISSIILVTVLTYVLVVVTIRVFSLFNDLYDKIFEMLGINSQNGESNDSKGVVSSVTGSDLIQAFVGYQLYSSSVDKLSGINMGSKFKDLKLAAKNHAINRVGLYDAIMKDPEIADSKKMEKYFEYIKGNPKDYGSYIALTKKEQYSLVNNGGNNDN